MQTMQNMSRDKMVIATMHRPSTAILNQFHKVLVLDHGGQMAYWGGRAGHDAVFPEGGCGHGH